MVVSTPHVERPHVRWPHMRRPHVNPWLVAVVALAAALVGLGTWMLVNRDTSVTSVSSTSTEVISTFSVSDPRGDVVRGPGPDLTSVSVSGTSTMVTSGVTLAQVLPLGQKDEVGVYIDVPPLQRAPGLGSVEQPHGQLLGQAARARRSHPVQLRRLGGSASRPEGQAGLRLRAGEAR
jgi:hypothetical protein